MKQFFLNRLTSNIFLKLGITFFKNKHCVKRSGECFKQNFTELSRTSFFRTIVLLPNITNPQNQFSKDKNNNYQCFFNLALNFIFVSLTIIFIITVIFGLITLYFITRVLGISKVFPSVFLKGIINLNLNNNAKKLY